MLLALIIIRYIYKTGRWLKRKRFCTAMLKKLHKQHEAAGTGKDLVVGATIPNVMAINGDIERAPSQIYSVTGKRDEMVIFLQNLKYNFFFM